MKEVYTYNFFIYTIIFVHKGSTQQLKCLGIFQNGGLWQAFNKTARAQFRAQVAALFQRRLLVYKNKSSEFEKCVVD